MREHSLSASQGQCVRKDAGDRFSRLQLCKLQYQPYFLWFCGLDSHGASGTWGFQSSLGISIYLAARCNVGEMHDRWLCAMC